MAHIYRVVVSLLVAFFPALATAQACGMWNVQSQETGQYGDFPSAAEACDWSKPNNTPDYSYTLVSSTGGSCVIERNDGQFLYGQATFTPCTECPPPQVLENGVCVSPPDPECEIPLGSPSNSSSAQMTGPNYAGGMMCQSNCVSYPSFAGKSTDGQWFANGPWTSTGIYCSGSGTGTGGAPGATSPGSAPPDAPPPAPPPEPPAPPPPNCSAGLCPGAINGTMVCMPCAGGATPGSSSGGSSGSGSPGGSPGNGGGDGPSDPVDEDGDGDSEGEEETTGSTTCDGERCTTTRNVTGVTDDGSPYTREETETETKDSFCQKNPRSPLCVTSAFGGACASGFACEGDAVQCAIARQQHVRACALFDDMSSQEAQLYEQRKGLTGDQTTALPGNETVAFGAGSIDTSNAIGGSSSCMPNVQVTVMGASLSLPFNVLCPYLEALGNVLMAVSMLLAGRIFMRG